MLDETPFLHSCPQGDMGKGSTEQALPKHQQEHTSLCVQQCEEDTQEKGKSTPKKQLFNPHSSLPHRRGGVMAEGKQPEAGKTLEIFGNSSAHQTSVHTRVLPTVHGKK